MSKLTIINSDRLKIGHNTKHTVTDDYYEWSDPSAFCGDVLLGDVKKNISLFIKRKPDTRQFAVLYDIALIIDSDSTFRHYPLNNITVESLQRLIVTSMLKHM
jgi:hypothetical protein